MTYYNIWIPLLLVSNFYYLIKRSGKKTEEEILKYTLKEGMTE